MKPVIHPDSLEWWFWPVILFFLVLGMFGWTNGFYVVVVVSAVQAIHFFSLEKSLKSYPTQVRFVYFLFTAIGLFDPTRIWFGLMTISTFMVAFFDKCLLSAILIQMPWNKGVKPGWKRP